MYILLALCIFNLFKSTKNSSLLFLNPQANSSDLSLVLSAPWWYPSNSPESIKDKFVQSLFTRKIKVLHCASPCICL